MIIAKVTQVQMTYKAEDVMTARQYREASEWLTSWSCENNIKKVVATSYDEAVSMLRKQVQTIVTLRQYQSEVFEMRVVYEEVKDGYFWEPRSGYVGFEKVVDIAD